MPFSAGNIYENSQDARNKSRTAKLKRAGLRDVKKDKTHLLPRTEYKEKRGKHQYQGQEIERHGDLRLEGQFVLVGLLEKMD